MKSIVNSFYVYFSTIHANFMNAGIFFQKLRYSIQTDRKMLNLNKHIFRVMCYAAGKNKKKKPYTTFKYCRVYEYTCIST